MQTLTRTAAAQAVTHTRIEDSGTHTTTNFCVLPGNGQTIDSFWEWQLIPGLDSIKASTEEEVMEKAFELSREAGILITFDPLINRREKGCGVRGEVFLKIGKTL